MTIASSLRFLYILADLAHCAAPPWWQVVTVRGVARRMRRLLYALSMCTNEVRKEKKEYSIVEKGDKKSHGLGR